MLSQHAPLAPAAKTEFHFTPIYPIHPMTASELKNHPTTLALIAIQESLGLKDGPFRDLMRFDFHGNNWGKIRKGTYRGNYSAVLTKLEVALAAYQNPESVDAEEGIVILPHVKETLDALEIAKESDDEHRLVIVSGHRGSGKTRTLHMCRHRVPGHYMEALPSWGGSYFDFLMLFAEGLGMELSSKRSKGALESAILDESRQNPRPIYIDEMNYFSPNAINFLKTMLNRVPAPIVTATIPKFLAGLRTESRTAQEAAQFVRRAVAIVHIPEVTDRAVFFVQKAFFRKVSLTQEDAKAIAAAANELDRMDSVTEILDLMDINNDAAKSIGLHRRLKQTSLKKIA